MLAQFHGVSVQFVHPEADLATISDNTFAAYSTEIELAPSWVHEMFALPARGIDPGMQVNPLLGNGL